MQKMMTLNFNITLIKHTRYEFKEDIYQRFHKKKIKDNSSDVDILLAIESAMEDYQNCGVHLGSGDVDVFSCKFDETRTEDFNGGYGIDIRNLFGSVDTFKHQELNDYVNVAESSIDYYDDEDGVTVDTYFDNIYIDIFGRVRFFKQDCEIELRASVWNESGSKLLYDLDIPHVFVDLEYGLKII